MHTTTFCEFTCFIYTFFLIYVIVIVSTLRYIILESLKAIFFLFLFFLTNVEKKVYRINNNEKFKFLALHLFLITTSQKYNM